MDQAVLLQALTAIGRALFGAAACSVALLEPDDAHLVFRAASGAGAAEVLGVRLPVGRGIAGWVVSSGQPIAIRDVRADPRFARDVAESTGYVPTVIAAAPVIGDIDVMGVIEVLDPTPAADREDEALLALLAAQVAVIAATRAGSTMEPELFAAVESVAAQGLAEQRAAAAILRTFVYYAEGRDGPARMV